MITMTNNYCSSCEHLSSLPIRSTWARAVLNKIESDRCLAKIDRTQWYQLSNKHLLDNQYQKYFQQFNEDKETTDFIQQSITKSDNVPLQIFQSLLTTLLTLFITRTSG